MSRLSSVPDKIADQTAGSDETSGLTETPSLAKTLGDFTHHLRQPNSPVPAGLDHRRVGIYRELVYNNIESCLNNAFPVTVDILDNKTWDLLLSEFIATFRAQTPYFSRLPNEFVRFIEQLDIALHNCVFLAELVRYEWLELDMYLRPDSAHKLKPEDDSIENTPLGLIDDALVEAWEYPVHRIGPELSSQTAEATYLLIYRDVEGDVQFMELQALAYIVLTTLQIATKDRCYLTPKEILLELIDQSGAEDVTQFLDQGMALFRQLNGWGVLFNASKFNASTFNSSPNQGSQS